MDESAPANDAGIDIPPELFVELGSDDDPDELPPAVLSGEDFDAGIVATCEALDRGDTATANGILADLREGQAADVELAGVAVGVLEQVEDESVEVRPLERYRVAAELRASARRHRAEAHRVTRLKGRCEQRFRTRARPRPRGAGRPAARRASGLRAGQDPGDGDEESKPAGGLAPLADRRRIIGAQP